MSEQINNPVNDCEKAKDLLLDEIARWKSFPEGKCRLFASLLKDKKEFEGFLSMVGAEYLNEGLTEVIRDLLQGENLWACRPCYAGQRISLRIGIRIGSDRHDRPTFRYSRMGTSPLS